MDTVVMELLSELRTDIKEVKQDIGVLKEQGAVHNHILNEHQKRSTQMEEEFKLRVPPLETDLKFRQKLAVFILGGSGLIGMASLIVAILALRR